MLFNEDKKEFYILKKSVVKTIYENNNIKRFNNK
jgi:hypothetical protein